MTTVDILLRYVAAPTEAQVFALANARDVYGIRRISFDHAAQTVRVEFDASRMKEDTIAGLLRRAGLDLTEKVALA